MPYTKVNNSVSGLDKLAKTIAVPREYKAERIPTFPALERTGVLSFTDTNTATVLTSGTLEAMVCRDPAYPVWVKQPVLSVGWSFYSMISGGGDNIDILMGTYVSLPVGPLSNFYTGSNTFTSVNDYSMPILKYDGQLYFYNVTDIFGINIRFNVAPGAVESVITLAVLDVNSNVMQHVYTTGLDVSAQSAGVAFVLPVGTIGFRITAVEVSTSLTTIVTSSCYGITTDDTVNPTGVISPLITTQCRPVLFPVTRPVEAATTTIPWKSVRATAVGALFSNVTAVLNKEGTVKAARVNSEIINPLYFGGYDKAIDRVYPKDRYFGPMENGLYTFTLPDSGSEQYRDILEHSYNTVTPVWVGRIMNPGIFDLDKLNYFNMIVFTDIGSSDSTLAITADRHIEFRSTSVLFPLGFSTCQLETYHAAQMALVQLGVFFENPVHLGLIGSAVAQAVRAVASYAYPVVRQVGQAALMAAGDKIVSMANKKLGQMSQARMVKQPTTPVRRTPARRVKVKTNRKK
jgi:hypothetical protein